MSQKVFNLTGPLEWEDSEFWGKTSLCRQFSIRTQTMNGKTEHVLWRRGADGRVIPKHLGAFATFEEAVAKAEDEKYDQPHKYNRIHDWKPRWPK